MHFLEHVFFDSLKIIPFIFVMYLAIEYFEHKKSRMQMHSGFFGAADGSRTRTPVGHQHLKLASLPIPAQPQTTVFKRLPCYYSGTVCICQRNFCPPRLNFPTSTPMAQRAHR